ncbi:ShlB/FhaC/HecB family hemolysin secretion/activation protein [Methylomonas fluvii]|uniref:ShlB/FhaC/HecB family hemolysin secretion/activation protein n=1 Tax=Methylomonas fluvii TaxID=1854564 RepID=A0ABR9DBX1_9GAMM|nr:ShlB/FhaC/HecB family hemolysin secretion/activation protein [Methylomonas fluvii]MBD9360612.1 ShlB/FhaC/HecB family hemolysin secretion/activation protein [Methylomonas fluvii]
MMRQFWLPAISLILHGMTAGQAAELNNLVASPQNPANSAGLPEVAPLESGGQPPHFDVLDYQIEGNSVLDDETLERAVYAHLGPDKTVADVEQARSSLEQAYRNAGYPTVVVTIPEQDVEGGAVRLGVVEGTVETLYISGSRYYALGKIRDGLPALAEGQVPHMPKVQEQMNTLAQQSADRNVTPVFRAGSTPGKMEVELKVKDALPMHGNLELNTRNSEHTSYTRLLGSLRYDNLWQKFHSVSMQYQVSPEISDEVQVWSGTYVLPTGWSDTRLALYGIGISSNTQLGVSVGGLSVVGAGSIYGARLVKPLPGSSENILHSLSFGFDYKSFDQQVASLTENAPISYASFMTGYDGSLRSDSSVTALSLAAHFSIRGLGNDAKQFASKRLDAEPNFLYLTGDLKHQQRLPLDFRLLARAGGQASMSALISNEQFSAGGPLSVRGYHQTQLLGDHGVNLSLELQTPHLAPAAWDDSQNLRLLTFFDWANIWTDNPIAPTPATQHLASTGIGLRTLWFRHLLAELDWSYPFYRQGTIDPGQQRVDFRVVYEF